MTQIPTGGGIRPYHALSGVTQIPTGGGIRPYRGATTPVLAN